MHQTDTIILTASDNNNNNKKKLINVVLHKMFFLSSAITLRKNCTAPFTEDKQSVRHKVSVYVRDSYNAVILFSSLRTIKLCF